MKKLKHFTVSMRFRWSVVLGMEYYSGVVRLYPKSKSVYHG